MKAVIFAWCQVFSKDLLLLSRWTVEIAPRDESKTLESPHSILYSNNFKASQKSHPTNLSKS